MMVISLGKNSHNLLYCGCTRTKAMDSLYFLFESVQLRLVSVVAWASRSCTTNGNPFVCLWKKRLQDYGDLMSPTLGYHLSSPRDDL